MRILVAEKSHDTRRAIVDALACLDTVAVQGAVPGLRAAARAISDRAPDIVVTGTELLDGSGLELIEVTQQLAPRSRIVVVGQGSTRDVWRRHLAAGAHRFVECDASLDELRDVVCGLALAPSASIDDELRLLGRMTAGIIHDLNNYLGAVGATLSLLQLQPGNPDLAARAADGVDQANRLTASLLRYVRGEPGGFEELEFGELITRTLGVLEKSLPPTVRLKVELAAKMPRLTGVKAELEQLVLNLVINAVDAMPAGGELAVRATPTVAGAMYFEVTDSGATPLSIPQSQDGITTSSTKPGRKLGLGLGIVHRVVDHHGGAIAIAPRRDGKGSTATVLLPLRGRPS